MAMSQRRSSIDLDAILLPPCKDFGIKSGNEKDFQQDQKLGGHGNAIVVENLPVLPQERSNVFRFILHRLYSCYGVIKEGGLWMPTDPGTQETLGRCFIEFDTPQEAEHAMKRTNGYKFNKIHIFAVSLVDDFDTKRGNPMPNSCREAQARRKCICPGCIFRTADIPISPVEMKPYENLQQWLTDGKARDQFVIRTDAITGVFWNDGREMRPELICRRSFWTLSFVQWSPLGTYLATFHRQEAAIWGGADTFNCLMLFAHPQVKLIDFSPGEKYLVTYSSDEPSNPHDDAHRVVLNIFDVRTGKLMCDFKGNADEFSIGGSGVSGVTWPIFRWGGGRDDKYFARIGKNIISVYETETFALVDKKSLKVDNVVDFSWSPTDPILALFIPEQGGGNQPAMVSLIQIPGNEELRQKNLFSVGDCKMHWQSSGEYLAVKVDTYTKTKKSTYTVFELFRIKERDVPNEVLELDDKNDEIIAFAWEPRGHRLAIIHGDSHRPDISFYSMRTASSTGRVSKLATLKAKQANALFWSPGGRFIVLAGLKGFTGQLEFFDVDELETMAIAEHFMATDIEWDPSGRYVATAVTSVHEMENGFHIWTFYGKLLYGVSTDHLHQILWRPRPPSLSAEREKIFKNLKKYNMKYEMEVEDIIVLIREQERLRQKALQEESDKWVCEWKPLHEKGEGLRKQPRDGESSDGDEEYDFEEAEMEKWDKWVCESKKLKWRYSKDGFNGSVSGSPSMRKRKGLRKQLRDGESSNEDEEYEVKEVESEEELDGELEIVEFDQE